MSTAISTAPKQEFIKTINESQDLFDVAAACYYFIITSNEQKMTDDSSFIARFNSFLSTVNGANYYTQFQQEVSKLMDLEEVTFSRYSQVIDNWLKSHSEDNEILSYCALVVLYFVDFYYTCNGIQLQYARNNGLNQTLYKDFCVIYPQERNSFLSAYYLLRDQEHMATFRKPLRHTRVGEIFRSILIIPEKLLAGVRPSIYYIPLSDESKAKLRKDRCIKIAGIPFTGYNTFDFCDPSTGTTLDEVTGAFSINYDRFSEKDEALYFECLSKAADSGANIIVFPEFIFYTSITNKLKRFLETKKYADLWLVIAGTSLEYNNERNKGSNTMHVFTGTGVELPGYTKHTPFIARIQEYVHGVRYGAPKEDKSTMSERFEIPTCIASREEISNFNGVCTIFDIEDVGRVLPAVCRDVIEGEYTQHLAEMFMPSLLLIPAWSSSVQTFETKLKSLADSLHVVSLLCNCCNAVSSEKQSVGMFVLPKLIEGAMNAQVINLSRKDNCTLSCTGCVNFIELQIQDTQLCAEVKCIT